jgi:hypothetical protein
MPDVKISELPAGTATANAIVPVTNAAGTATEKVTLGDVAALVADASQLTTGTLDDARLSANVILADDPRWLALAPAAPTLTATGGNESVSLSWTAPSSLLTITDYIIQYSSDSGATWTTVPDGVSAGTTYEITGLTNGTEYTLRVAAVSGVGAGAWSNSATALPASLPSYNVTISGSTTHPVSGLYVFSGTNNGENYWTRYTDGSPTAYIHWVQNYWIISASLSVTPNQSSAWFQKTDSPPVSETPALSGWGAYGFDGDVLLTVA